VFERLYGKVHDAIREGETIAQPLKENARPRLNLITAFWWAFFLGGPIGLLLYLLKWNQPVIEDMVINMIDVGEETGELDTMLYKVADTYDEEVSVLTEALTSLMEPLLIIILGCMVGFIVIALFLPLITIISELS
jgi:type IV pilus assembly protein PilC